MKNFFLQIRDSLSKSHIYKNPENLSVGKALKYIAVLVIVFSLIKTAVLATFMGPAIEQFRSFAENIVNDYPNDLVVTLAKGEVSMNKPSPYIVPFKKIEGEIKGLEKYENILVIDTEKSLDFMAYKAYNTAILVTKIGFIAEKENGAMEAQTFKQFPDYVLSKQSLVNMMGKFDSFLSALPITIMILTITLSWIVILIGSYVGALFLSLLGVLVVLIVTKIKKHSLPFSKLYALSLYGYTIVFLLGIIKTFFPFSGWISFAVFVGLFFLFISDKSKTLENK